MTRTIRKRSKRLRRVLSCAYLALMWALLAAPTPGDIGGCQPARELDGPAFFDIKASLDCDRCDECGLDTLHCRRACNAQQREALDFPDGCVPLAHDGAVCIRALMYASCDDYAEFMADVAPTVPTECHFCPAQDSP